MEAEVIVWRDEEGLEQVALSQRVQLPRDVNISSDGGDGTTKPEDPKTIGTELTINETAMGGDT